MKNTRFFMAGMLAVLLTFVLILAGCASSEVVKDGGSVVAGSDESVIIIQRASTFVGAAVKYKIFVDGQIKCEIANGKTEGITVKNGEHTIYADSSHGLSDRIAFTTVSGDIKFFSVKPEMNKVTLVLE
jgi:hypothetical protein